MLQLFLNVGTPMALKLSLYRDDAIIDWGNKSGASMATTTLFIMLFVMQAFSGAVGLVAVYMQRTGSLVLAFVLQIGSAGATVTAMACSVVYIEVHAPCTHAARRLHIDSPPQPERGAGRRCTPAALPLHAHAAGRLPAADCRGGRLARAR